MRSYFIAVAFLRCLNPSIGFLIKPLAIQETEYFWNFFGIDSLILFYFR